MNAAGVERDQIPSCTTRATRRSSSGGPTAIRDQADALLALLRDPDDEHAPRRFGCRGGRGKMRYALEPPDIFLTISPEAGGVTASDPPEGVGPLVPARGGGRGRDPGGAAREDEEGDRRQGRPRPREQDVPGRVERPAGRARARRDQRRLVGAWWCPAPREPDHHPPLLERQRRAPGGDRHSYGTPLAAQGVPMRTLQEWMGHRDIQTTQRDRSHARCFRWAATNETCIPRRSTQPRSRPASAEVGTRGCSRKARPHPRCGYSRWKLVIRAV